jgi:hypothetical protein
MAALAVLAGSTALGTIPAARAEEPPVANTVRLQLRITGLSGSGCTLKITPAHPGCQFKPIVRRVPPTGGGSMLPLEPIALTATSTGADRDCSFAITIQEPGQPPQTFRRGIRLLSPTAGQAVPVQTVKVYLSATSLAARDAAGKARR